MTDVGTHFDVVCCSLEPWDDVWRRNQFFVSELLAADPSLRLLFVELPVDVAWSVLTRREIGGQGRRTLGDTGRLWAMAPRKLLPRRIWPYVDRSLARQVLAAARGLGFDRPVLWINDSTYSTLVRTSGLPSVYDVTDDWLLGNYPPREIDRQRRNDQQMLTYASEVVVCSPALVSARGQTRPVRLISNGVDVDHFRRSRERPSDLPSGPVVLYTGTLNAGRLDVDLSVELARALTGRASLVFVGPSSLSGDDEVRLTEAGAVLLGARPYADVPGYLQHADVLVVPHVVTPFTESLDPIKAREILAVGRPAVSTPVAGMRELTDPVVVAEAPDFVAAVERLVTEPALPPGPGPMLTSPVSWRDRADEFLTVLRAAAEAGRDAYRS